MSRKAKPNPRSQFIGQLIERFSKEKTRALFEEECAKRKQAERSQRLLKYKLDVIRDVLRDNDIDGAKRHLENMNISFNNRIRSVSQGDQFDRSAGSLLDPANTSVPEINLDQKRISSRYNLRQSVRKSTGSIVNGSHRPSVRRSVDTRNNSNNRIDSFSTSKPLVGRKRSSDKSDDSYFGVVKRPMMTSDISGNFKLMQQNFLTSDESGSAVYTATDTDQDFAGESNDKDVTKSPWNTTLSRFNRPHDFVCKTVLNLELCSVCGRRIMFAKAAQRCNRCRLLIHPGCLNQLVQVCIPTSAIVKQPASSSRLTPTTSKGGLTNNGGSSVRRGTPNLGLVGSSPATPMRCASNRLVRLDDLCLLDGGVDGGSLEGGGNQPCVPALVVHCVNEVVARGLQTVGIYRVSGYEKQVKDLLDKFLRGKTTPSLALVDDIHVVCGCLKLFLRSLTEPLVTFELRARLIQLSDSSRNGASTGDEHDSTQLIVGVMSVLRSLPRANRDTLAYVMLHLKQVAQSPICKMNDANLSTVFGPTLIGYSCPDPQMVQAVHETIPQQAVMRLLFRVPDSFYTELLEAYGGDDDQSNSMLSTTDAGDTSAEFQTPPTATPTTYFPPLHATPTNAAMTTPLRRRPLIKSSQTKSGAAKSRQRRQRL